MQNDNLTSLLIFTISFFFYYPRVFKTVPGGDTGELLCAAKAFGIAHPPGYPLFTFLSGLVINYIPFGTPVQRVGLILSVVPQCLCLVFVFKTARRLGLELYKVFENTFIDQDP